MFIGNRGVGVAALALCGMTLAFGQDAEPARQPKKPSKARVKAEVRNAADEQLSLRLEEARALREKAGAVTRALGEMASSGKLPQDAQGIQTLEQLVAELKAINGRLEKIETEVHAIQGWVQGKEKTLPKLEDDVAKLKKEKASNYVQFQYLDDSRPGNSDSFRMRRVRLGLTDTLDARTSMKLSFDLAATQFGALNEPAESAAQLRDAFLTYQLVPASETSAGTVLRGGRQPLPLGYEIERSSSDREFPERAQYNQALFPGERTTGLLATHDLGDGLTGQVGVYNALTFNDPQQRTSGAAKGSKLGAFAALRHAGDRHSVGLSAFKGERETLVSDDQLTVNPSFDREFIYLDGMVKGLLDPRLTLRAEAMQGKDRLGSSGTISGTASASNTERDVRGHHFQLGYQINPRNQINVRWEQFDRDVDASGDTLSGWGLAYVYQLSSNARLTAAFEEFNDPLRSTEERYRLTTLRVQFKF